MVGALLYVLVLAPALDFLPSAKVPAVYHTAVSELAKLPVCNEAISRPVKDDKHGRSDLDGGEMSHFDVSQDSWLTCSHLLCPSVALLDVSIIHLAHLPLAPFSALTPRVAREKRHLAPWLTWA